MNTPLVNMKKLWTCEYSLEQDCFHIDKLEKTIMRNMCSAMKFNTTSYMLIGIFDNVDNAYACADEFKKVMVSLIKENGGEFECANCVYRESPGYFSKRDICEFKEDDYSCMECL